MQRHLPMFSKKSFSSIIGSHLEFLQQNAKTNVCLDASFLLCQNNCLSFRKQYSSIGPTLPLDRSCLGQQCILGLVILSVERTWVHSQVQADTQWFG